MSTFFHLLAALISSSLYSSLPTVEATRTTILHFVDSLGEDSARELFGPDFSRGEFSAALDRAVSLTVIVEQPPTNREYRTCATTEPGRQIWIGAPCWNSLNEGRRELLLVHEFLLFAEVSDADYRISAIAWASRSKPAAEILRSLSVLPSLRTWGSSVTFFSSAGKSLNAGEGGSTGVKGGGDADELVLKTRLVTAAFALESSGELHFETEAHEREFWRAVLTLDLVSVGGRNIPGSDRTEQSWATTWKDVVTQVLKETGVPAEGAALENAENEADRVLLRALSYVALSKSKASE